MPAITFQSNTIPALAAEAARVLMQAERSLTTPQTRVTMSFGETLLTITGSVPLSVAAVAADGGLKASYTNYTPDYTIGSVAGTPLSDLTLDNLSEVMAQVIIAQDAEERAKLAANETLPTGVGTTYAIEADQMTFSTTVPYDVSLNSGEQVISVTDYLS